MPELRADCSRCFGLCCVAPGFAASADFAVDKPPGTPCRYLDADFRCEIHGELRDRGFAGCTVFDCLGAGQRVAQETFGGRDWRAAPETAEQMFAAFGAVRQLHELLWHLDEALGLAAGDLRDALGRARRATEALAAGSADELEKLDVAVHRAEVGHLLGRVSALVRSRELRAGGPDGDDLQGTDLQGADLVGKDLRRTDLRAADIRGAWLIGADLRGVDLDGADLIGADLRAARLDGADLRRTLFLTPPQVAAAIGSPATRLPESIPRPAHWSAPAGPTPVGAPRPRASRTGERRRP